MPDLDQHTSVFLSALKTWGKAAQVDMVHEEIHELGLAVSRWERGRATPEEVATEIADVRIMMAQLDIMLQVAGMDPSVVESEIERKIARLKGRLEAHDAQ